MNRLLSVPNGKNAKNTKDMKTEAAYEAPGTKTRPSRGVFIDPKNLEVATGPARRKETLGEFQNRLLSESINRRRGIVPKK